MTDEKIMEIGRKHGMSLFADLRKEHASAGEMLGVASFALKGIMLWIAIDTGKDIKEIRKTFNACLDILLFADELKT